MAIASARPDQRSFEHHVLDFLAYLEYERGLSRNTLEAYRSDLLQLGGYLDRAGVDVLSAQHEHLAGFLAELAAGAEERRPVAAATLQRKAACLRSFYRHLRRENVIEHDPTAELRAPRKSQKLPQVLTRGEVAQLLAAPKGTDAAALRDRALLELMYACGLRASEAIDLEVGDVDLRHGVLRARGKGSKERLVPVGREAITAVKAYLQRGRPELVGLREERRLFVNRRGGGPHPAGPLQDRAAPRALRCARGQDEPAHAAPHVRHASARRRMRPARGAGDARPRRHRDDPDLHASVGRAAEGRLLRRASPRGRLTHWRRCAACR